MKRIISTLALLSLTLAFPLTGALAAEKPTPPYNDAEFKECDKSNDGYLTQEEFTACWPTQAKAGMFQKLNTKGDGKLTEQEMKIGWPDLHRGIDASEGAR